MTINFFTKFIKNKNDRKGAHNPQISKTSNAVSKFYLINGFKLINI